MRSNDCPNRQLISIGRLGLIRIDRGCLSKLVHAEVVGEASLNTSTHVNADKLSWSNRSFGPMALPLAA